MKTLIALSALFLATTLSAFADTQHDGTDRGNPGDDYALSFIDTGHDVAENLAKDPLPAVDARTFLAAVENTKVSSKDRLFKGDQEVAGLNYPDPANPMIEMSRTRWDGMKAESYERVKIVFHEYLGIMGIDDTNFRISSQLDRAKVCDRSPQIRSMIEHQLKKSCYRVIPDDLQYVVSAWMPGSGLKALKNSDFQGLVGLENLYLQQTQIGSVDHGFFRQFPKMDELSLGNTFTSMDDCSFFASMPALRGFSAGDVSFDADSKNFKPLRAIAPGCFSALPNLLHLSIPVDGATTKLAGFLRGVPEATRTLMIIGVNLERIPVAELATGQRRINLRTLDHALPTVFLNELSKAFPPGCSSSAPIANDAGSVYYDTVCEKR